MRIRLALLVLVSLFGSASVYAEDVYQRAEKLFSEDQRHLIVRLPPAIQQQLQRYYDAVNLSINFVEEQGQPLPEVVLMLPGEKDYAAVVIRGSPEFIFVNPIFFLQVKYVDIDRYVMGHERRHFERENRDLKDERSKEYDADGFSIYKRLFRSKLRDAKGNPQAAVAHPETLMEYLVHREETDEYIFGKTFAAAIKVLYAQEFSRRYFPERPEPRVGLENVIAAVAEAVKAYKEKLPEREKRNAVNAARVENATMRIQGEFPAALLKLDERRKAEGDSYELTSEFIVTVTRIKEVLQGLRKQKRSEAFDQFAGLPRSLFRDWRPLLQEYERESRDRTLNPSLITSYSYSEWDFDFSAGKDVEMVRLLSSLQPYSTPLRSEEVILLWSRLMAYWNAQHGAIDLNAQPKLIVALNLVLKDVERVLGSPNHSKVYQQFLQLYGETLRRGATDPSVWVQILKCIEADPTDHVFINFIFSKDFDEIFPGLRSYLRNHLKFTDKSVFLKFILQTDNLESLTAQLKRFLKEERYQEFLQFFVRSHDYFRFHSDFRQNLDSVWADFISTNPAKRRDLPYVAGLASAVDGLYSAYLLPVRGDSATYITDVEKIKNEKLRSFSDKLTALALLNPVQFITAWSSDKDWDESLGAFSAFPILINWDQVFASVSLADLQRFSVAGAGTLFQIPYKHMEWFRQAFLRRLVQLIENETQISREVLDLATVILRQASAVSPESQLLTKTVMRRLALDSSVGGAEKSLHFLRSTLITNFTDTDLFVNSYVQAIVQKHGRPLSLGKVRAELPYLRENLDPQIATRILNKLAAECQATPEAERDFSYGMDGRSDKVAVAIADFHLWTEVFRGLEAHHVLNLVDSLRGTKNLSRELQTELRIRLIQLKIYVRTEDVEHYIRQRFSQFTPIHRAGFLNVLLEGCSDLLESARFRRNIYLNILSQIPERKTQEVFLEIWEAGMNAIPNTLRSLVLSVVLSESGKAGSPERALVTLLSHMGAMEQKFGQMLAFTELPESYRRELRSLWDSAQEVNWWDGWELLKAQKGDIQAAGYRLSRVLHSGSTEAFLEIIHEKTGRRFVVPVFRDGIHQGVEVSTIQLRKFAAHLAKANPKRYGYLPLLVEDTIRTMKMELNPEHKRKMTGEMKVAYENAARRLGYRVDEQGIHVGSFRFTNVPFVPLQLENGRVIYAQEVADGEPLRGLRETDPALYQSLTRQLLQLEDEVLKDPRAPVDKDRMPGQNIFSRASQTNYILDHGQALHLDAKVHAVFLDFTQRGFAGDARGMAAILTQLTQIASFDLAAISSLLSAAEVGLRPLIFLNAVSPPFLALKDEDPRKEYFFQLLHGVRAKLRLLQWEQSESHDQTLQLQVRQEVMDSMTAAQILGAAWSGVWASARETITALVRGSWSQIPLGSSPTRRMDRAYRREPTPGVASAERSVSCGALLKGEARAYLK